MIRSTPSYRAGRHFGAFLLMQASATWGGTEAYGGWEGQVARPHAAGAGGSGPAWDAAACRVRCCSWREAHAASSPPPPACNCMQIMGLGFAVIAPLILPPVAFFFFTAWVSSQASCAQAVHTGPALHMLLLFAAQQQHS